MSVAVQFEELLMYSDHERGKWREWFAADPTRLDIPVQSGGRFPTVGALLDHVFLVERRHLSRLEGATPPDATGIAAGQWQDLFDYADLVRADLLRYAGDLGDRATETFSFTLPMGEFTMTRRKLLLHIVVHEIRHFAQVASAARAAGVPPPGEHDFFYTPGFP